MRTYEKKLKPYLILGVFSGLLFYWLTNFFIGLPGTQIGQKELALMSLSPEVKDNFAHWWNYLAPSLWAIIAFAVGYLLAMVAYLYQNDHGIYRNGEEHGSARFARQSEMDKYADKDESYNLLLSQNGRMGIRNRRLARENQKNKNTFVIGGAGSGKTFNYLKPNLMQMNSSFVVTDPKGLLVREIGTMLENNGYQIKVFDLARLKNSNHFNVFNYMPDELDIDRVLEGISIAVQDADKKKDFWQLASDMLVRSLIALLWFDGKDNGYTPNLSQVAVLLRGLIRDDEKVPSPTEELFEEVAKKHPDNYASKQFNAFKTTAGAKETQAGVIGNAVSIFGGFDHQAVVNLINHDDMDIDSWNEQKTAVFIHIPEMSSSYNFLASLLVSTSITKLSQKADDVNQGIRQTKTGEPLLHVRYWLDEFANIGKLPNIDKALATLRSREMSVVPILQALDQLQAMYKNSWKGLLGTADTLIFLGGNEKETSEYLSQRAGKQTISIRNHSISNGRGGSENRQTQARDLMTPDEITRLDNQKCLVFINGEYAYMDDKYSTLEHPRANELGDNPNDPNWYNYKIYQDEQEEMLDKVNKGEFTMNDLGRIAGTGDGSEVA